MDLTVLCVEVRTYSYNIQLASVPFPEINFKLSLIECLFDLISMREMNRNRTASTGVFFGRKNSKIPLLGKIDDLPSLR